ncbi:hypothetical protein B0H34DRAFT_213820 [Crassisporium funariophilum]|nr:hypothetical protein B0H34DRAFT_213820 [Crassisporium funariophilum]
MIQDLNKTLALVRTVVFGVVSVFSLAAIILGGLITSFTSSYFFGGYFTFAALGIATGLLTLLTLPVMLFLSMKRKGAITSMIAVEISWTWFLWIMWIAVGGSSAGTIWIGDCASYGSSRLYTSAEAACRETQALTAFGFLNWIMLFFYNITLFVFVIRQHMRGHTGIWTGYVTETDYASTGPNSTMHTQDKVDPAFAPQYPPVTAQQTGVQGVPQTQTTSPYPQV